MPHLHAILLTKDDDLIIGSWLARHHGLFKWISVVDGSRSGATETLCATYENVIHRRDPAGLITDQTLRHAAFEQLRPNLAMGDWIFVAHPDEFLLHDPRSFMSIDANLMMWLPLPVLPHTSERSAWETAEVKNPVNLFKHYWWRQGSLPHCEHRMWRYVKEPVWDLQNPKKSSTVIPVNFHGESISSALPLYLHYKCFDLDVQRYDATGSSTVSGLNTGLPVAVNTIDDLFFDEQRPFGDGYFHCAPFQGVDGVFSQFGNPPMARQSANRLQVVNGSGQPIH
jgi:Glycosyl transferase family 2